MCATNIPGIVSVVGVVDTPSLSLLSVLLLLSHPLSLSLSLLSSSSLPLSLSLLLCLCSSLVHTEPLAVDGGAQVAHALVQLHLPLAQLIHLLGLLVQPGAEGSRLTQNVYLGRALLVAQLRYLALQLLEQILHPSLQQIPPSHRSAYLFCPLLRSPFLSQLYTAAEEEKENTNQYVQV